ISSNINGQWCYLMTNENLSLLDKATKRPNGERVNNKDVLMETSKFLPFDSKFFNKLTKNIVNFVIVSKSQLKEKYEKKTQFGKKKLERKTVES
ncbi:hypothetical protein Bhyg_11386, partial [Pseudolycoriella hygida]